MTKPAVYRKREKLGTKTAHFAASVSANFGVWVSLWSAVVLVVWSNYSLTIVTMMLLYRISR